MGKTENILNVFHEKQQGEPTETTPGVRKDSSLKGNMITSFQSSPCSWYHCKAQTQTSQFTMHPVSMLNTHQREKM